MRDVKPAISDVRAAWKRGLSETPDASSVTVTRALAHLAEQQTNQLVNLTFSDWILGATFCVALSLIMLLPFSQSYSGTTANSTTPDLSTYIGQDAVQEAFLG